MAPTPPVQAQGIRPIGPPPRGVPPTAYEGFHPGDAGPTAEFVAPAVSRRQGYYQGSYSVTTSCAVVPFDVVALGAQSRPARAYTAPRSAAISVYDQPAVGAPDSFTPGINSRPQGAYRGAASSFSGAADQDPGTMAFVSASRKQVATPVSRSQAINVFDNPTVTVADSWVSATASRSGARNYQGSYSLSIGAGVVPFDATALGSQSRSVAFYTPPRSRVIQVFDANAVISTDWVAGTNSRPQGRYRGAPSSFSGAADQDPGVMSFVAQSRPVAFYLAPRSRALNVFDNTVAAPDSFVAGTQSRAVAFYSPPRSLTITPSLGTPDSWTPGSQSRSVPFYRSPASVTVLGLPFFFPDAGNGGGGEWRRFPSFPGGRFPGEWQHLPVPDFPGPGGFKRWPRPDYPRKRS